MCSHCLQFVSGDTEAQVKTERVWVGMAPKLWWLGVCMYTLIPPGHPLARHRGHVLGPESSRRWKAEAREFPEAHGLAMNDTETRSQSNMGCPVSSTCTPGIVGACAHLHANMSSRIKCHSI